MEININESLRCTCGGTINPYTHKCEYCGTDYRNKFVKDLSYVPYDIDIVKLSSDVQLPDLSQMSEVQRRDVVYKAIEAVSLELAHKLLPYINWNAQTSWGFSCYNPSTLLTGELKAHIMIDTKKNYQSVCDELIRDKSDFMS